MLILVNPPDLTSRAKELYVKQLTGVNYFIIHCRKLYTTYPNYH